MLYHSTDIHIWAIDLVDRSSGSHRKHKTAVVSLNIYQLILPKDTGMSSVKPGPDDGHLKPPYTNLFLAS